MASAAVSSSTAARARIGSPWYTGSIARPRSPRGSALISAPRSVYESAGAGRSSCVTMPFTPGMARASRASMCKIRACGYGLSSSFAKIMPSTRKSSEYFAFPVTLAIMSGVVKFSPTSFALLGGVLEVTSGRSVAFALGSIGELDMFHPPREFSAPHQRSQNLVVILAPAEIARNTAREFSTSRIWICLEESNGGHYESGHAKGALETLLFHNSPLHGMKSAIFGRESFDCQDFLPPGRVREHRAGILRDVIDEYGTGAPFGAVTGKFGAGQPELVTQRHCQRLLLRDVDRSLTAVHVQR